MKKTLPFQKIRKMKKILFGLTLMFSITAISGFSQVAATTPAAAQPTSKADISFTSPVHDFGSIPQNVPASYSFSFKNTGTEPLVLSAVQPSCGCTTPEWPKEPIKPGATATIKATYNAANPGAFTKTITVTSNAANPQTIITIKGDVKPAVAPASTQAPVKAAPPKKN